MYLYLNVSLNRFDGCLYIGKPTCNAKVRFGSALQATKAAYHMEEKNAGERFDVYWCHFHECYHIGHSREDDWDEQIS